MKSTSVIAITTYFLLAILAIALAQMGVPDNSVLIAIIICVSLLFIVLCALLAYMSLMDNRERVREARQLVEDMDKKLVLLDQKWMTRLDDRNSIPRTSSAKIQQLVEAAMKTKTTKYIQKPGTDGVTKIEEPHTEMIQLLKEVLTK